MVSDLFSAKYKIVTQEMAKVFLNFAQVTKFRQIWSHCILTRLGRSSFGGETRIGTGSGSVGRVVTSNSKGPLFESSHC